MMISIVPAVVAHPEDRGISHVYGIQRDASDGKDSANNVHKHSEAHLRGEIPSIKTLIQAVFDGVLHFNYNRRHIFIYSAVHISFNKFSTYQAGRRELSGHNGHDSSYNELMRGHQASVTTITYLFISNITRNCFHEEILLSCIPQHIVSGISQKFKSVCKTDKYVT